MRRIALFLAAIALAACNDATSPNGSASGTYTLRTVNGSTLPYTFSDGSVLLSDQLVINSDGSYIDQAHFSNRSDLVEQGFWSINNNLITFNDQTDNFQYQGSLSGSVLTESFPQVIANHVAMRDVWKETKLRRIFLLLQGALNARDKVGLKMNLEESKLSDLLARLPALRNPTISPLAQGGWVAIETVIDETVVREIIPELKLLGAEGIIEYPLNKVVY